MANDTHLTKIKEGVKVWNTWRELNPKVKPSLSGANLSQANLQGANLSDANLEKADLTGADPRQVFTSQQHMPQVDKV